VARQLHCNAPEGGAMKRTVLIVGVLAAGLTLVGSREAEATIEMQKETKAAGFEVQGCTYCHVEKLPKKGASTYNERGKFLMAEKDKRKAAKIDVTWLKEYTEPKK
jgi:hypothetical protein